ncbi:hypothetical protein, partial [Microbacterium gubbeenense]|uniref:hypothetical protein n=1 Tax=Microbacterium gubbeenense TaxID=159896 RepID=UPI003F99EE0D
EGPPLDRRAHAESRAVHDRRHGEVGRQDGRAARGGRPHGAHLAPARRAPDDSAGQDRFAVRPLPERLRPVRPEECPP